MYLNHMHMFSEMPTKVSGFIRYLTGKSSTMLYEQSGEMKYRDGEVLTPGLFPRHGRKEHEPNCGVYQKSAEGRSNRRIIWNE